MIQSVLSERARKIKPSPTLAITAQAKALKAKGVDILSFAAGEPDFNTPDCIIEAAKKALEEGQTKYAPSRGIPQLAEAIQRKTSRENNFSCDLNQIVVSCGAKHAIYNSLQVLINPGDEVILIAPFWMTYEDQVILADGKPVIVQTSAETEYCPHPDQIKAAITPKTRAIICNSPTNPTGAAWPIETIKAIADLAEKHNLIIISDEIYEHITYGHPHTSFASLGSTIADRTVTILGVSKTYSMTGWRIGFTVSPAPIAAAIADFQDQVTSNATTFAQFGAAAALDSDHSLVDQMVNKFAERRQIGLNRIRQISNLSIVEPKGAFYFFINVEPILQKTGQSDIDLAINLLHQAQIALVPGSVFQGPGHLRMSYATNPDSILQGLDRLENALAQI